MMKVIISDEAVAHIKKKGSQVIIFRGSITGCCSANGIPVPRFEVGKPRRPFENYEILNESDITVFLDKELSSYQGIARITLDKTLWWKFLSFDYHEN